MFDKQCSDYTPLEIMSGCYFQSFSGKVYLSITILIIIFIYTLQICHYPQQHKDLLILIIRENFNKQNWKK